MSTTLPPIRRRRKQNQRSRKFVVLLVSAVLVGSLGYFFTYHGPEPSNVSSTERQQSTVHEEEPDRKSYLYSVIPGGVENSAELAAELQTDSVAAKHYADFRVDRAVLVYARFNQQSAYVSFRKNDRVFWTKKRVNIDLSEKLLTDGKNFARTRCGNRLADTPQKPTTENEPSEEALLFVPTFTESRVIRLPAELEEAPRLPLKPIFILPTPGAILPFEEVIKPVQVFSLTSGGATSILIPKIYSPEPGTIFLLASGCLAFAGFRIRQKTRRSSES